jgi:hypothetical protein
VEAKNVENKVTYRRIAKMLASALPIEQAEFAERVEDHLEAIKTMPKAQRQALRCAYIFSRKVPAQEREDLFQELALAILEAKVEDERLAYAIARCDWQDWWEKYMTRSHYYAGSLNATLEDGDGQEVEFGELLVGEVEFERKMAGKVDGQALWAKIPNHLKPIVNKRLIGKSITGGEKLMLNKWIAQRPTILAQ